MKVYKTIYWAATAIISALFLFSSGLNVFQYEKVCEFYQVLGFPTWLVYPSAILKVLAIIAILTRKSSFLKEWAYAGLFFDSILAFSAHQIVGDGAGLLAGIAAISVMVSRIFEEKVYPEKIKNQP
jgi:hypothetical protein